MNDFEKIFTIEFENLRVEIECNDDEALQLAEMLFDDVSTVAADGSPKPTKQYNLSFTSPAASMSLKEGSTQLYSGSSRYDLAYSLVNDVLFHCISGNMHQHAFHAGAVYRGNCGIILPGSSGSGKSTLTAWLIKNGFGYLTDELIFLAEDGKMTPFTRPINLKTREPIITPEFHYKHADQLLLSESGESMIPHRLLNTTFTVTEPYVTHFIFPTYRAGVSTELKSISSAQCCFKLIESHVNARNLPAHGIASLSNIARNCKAYTLLYSQFDGLVDIILSELD